jgi:hypothetical protein
MSAPIFMKMDTLVLGGLAVCMFLHKDDADPALVKELGADGLEHVPIGFMDLHKIDGETFSCSGLGIAKPYQGKGMSKYLIHAGLMISGLQKLYITTQLGNKMAHHAWMHLAPLHIEKIASFHDAEGSIIYSAEVCCPMMLFLYNQKIKAKLEHMGYDEIPHKELLKNPHLYEKESLDIIGCTENALLGKWPVVQIMSEAICA